jgi:glycerol-3-phosphate acyltransferase PlsX
MDCKPEYLKQFALMGSCYMRAVYGIEKPRVALMSVGTEDKKGNELTHAAFDMIKETPLNFVGNMEARDIFSGDFDAVIADGFVGNVALKTIEGTFSLFTKALKQEIKAKPCAVFGSLFMKGAFKKLKKRLDYSRMGGAAFLGCKKVVIKAHGSSSAISIAASILKAKMMAENNIIGIIEQELEKIMT